MENENKNRRKNYFIDKKFQATFIIKFCVLIIIGAVISGSIIYLMAKPTVTTTFENSRLVIKNTASYILPSVLLSSLVAIGLIGIATILITLFTSHRIAGPLYRMEKDVQELASGNLTKKFSLRKADELKALAESLDKMAQSLRNDIDMIKNGISKLEPTLKSQDSKDKLKEIKDMLEKFTT